MIQYGYSRFFLGSKETDEAMKELNTFRNSFVHFIPGSWSIEIELFPAICQQILLVIEFLVLESENVRFYDNDEFEKADLAKLIAKIRSELERLELESKQ